MEQEEEKHREMQSDSGRAKERSEEKSESRRRGNRQYIIQHLH